MTLLDVGVLVAAHDDFTNQAAGRPPIFLEVYKRAGIILTVTTWETFVEDALRFKFEERLNNAKQVIDVQSTFNAVAHAWLESKPDFRPKLTDLAAWTGKGWKSILVDKFQKDLAELNTPNSANVGKLFKRYLDIDITKQWKWQGVSHTTACDKLDKLIRFRGELVHRGKELAARVGVKRAEVVNAMRLVANLEWCTEVALGIALEDPVNIDGLLKR